MFNFNSHLLATCTLVRSLIKENISAYLKCKKHISILCIAIQKAKANEARLFVSFDLQTQQMDEALSLETTLVYAQCVDRAPIHSLDEQRRAPPRPGVLASLEAIRRCREHLEASYSLVAQCRPQRKCCFRDKTLALYRC